MPKEARRGSWARSRRWSEREALEALAALEQSGESLAAFARREGLSSEKLYRWRAKLSRQAFVEVLPDQVRPEEAPTTGAAVLEVVVTTGQVVRVPPDFDTEALRRLLAVLEADTC